jgi:hypothetical protein
MFRTTFILLTVLNRTLLALGAAITMFAAPLSFFFQQIVSYPSHWVAVNNASVPRSVIYDTDVGIFFVNGSRRIGPARPMIAALEPLFVGVNSSKGGTSPELKGICPTSKCTWKPFNTLAVCSRCTDLSDELLWGCSTGPTEWVSSATYSAIFSGRPNPNTTSCGYYLSPDGKSQVLLSGYTINADGSHGEALSTRFYPLIDTNPSSRAPIFNGSLKFQDIRNPIADFIVSGTPEGQIGAYKNAKPVVSECNLHWCVKTTQTEYWLGHPLETTTKTFLLDSPEGYPWKKFNVSGVAIPRWVANFSLSLSPEPQQDFLDNTFSVVNQTTVETILAWDQMLPSYVTSMNATSNPNLRWLNGGQFFGTPPQVIDMPSISNPWLPPNNITAQMELMADTMTTVMRNTPNVTNQLQMIQGMAWEQRTFVEIRWPWAVWPAGVLTMSLIFLMATISRSAEEENVVRVWKNSIIAVLFNGLDQDVRQIVGPNARLSEAREKARALRLRLVPE